MTVELLNRARSAGLALRIEGDRLIVQGPKPSDELLAVLRAGRDGLICALRIEVHEAIAAALTADAPEPPESDAVAAALTADALPTRPNMTPQITAAWIERAAAEALDGYQAPEPTPSLPEPGTPERVRFDTRQAAMVSGLLNVARQRPPSWSDPAALPSRGCFCSCCKGQRWWCERDAPKGWRCWTCHPPAHLAPEAVTEVRT